MGILPKFLVNKFNKTFNFTLSTAVIKTIEYCFVALIVATTWGFVIWLCVSGVGRKLDVWGNDEVVVEVEEEEFAVDDYHVPYYGIDDDLNYSGDN